MKIIQSFWSKPLTLSCKNVSQNRFNGGWISYRYFLLSMAYSCLSISKYHSEIEMYTDSLGASLFHDILRLPYHKIHTNLDDISHIDESFWAYGKITTYSEQKEPFIHIDNDVFIWQNLPDRIINANVVCQSQELIENYSLTDYNIAMEYIKCHFHHIPKILANSEIKTAANMGLFGGNNIDFILQYCKESQKVFSFLYNGIISSGNKKGIFNIIFEQLLLTEYAKLNNQKICYLIPSTDLDEIVKYSTIETAQYESKYVHCIGVLKQYNYVCEQIEYRLKYEYPLYYDRIISYLNKSKKEYIDSNISTKEYDSFCKIYSKISKAENITDIMTKYKFIIKSDIIIEEDGYNYFIKSQTCKYELTGWNTFLYLFSSANTGMDVCNEIFREKYIPNLPFEKIIENTFYLIMENLYITNILAII